MRTLIALACAGVLACAAFLWASPPSQAQAVTPDDEVQIQVQGNLGSVKTNPISMTPTFATGTTDYALRCRSGVNNVQVALTAASPSQTLSVSSNDLNVTPAPRTTIAVGASLGENQAIVLNVNGTTQYWIRCLPHDFPVLNVQKPGNPSPGWYATGNATGATDGSSAPYAMVLDSNGTPVWYQHAPGGAVDITVLPDNTLAWSRNLGPGVGATPNGGFTTYAMGTQTSGFIGAPSGYTDAHELVQLPNGNRVVITTPLLQNVNLSGLPNASLRGYSAVVNCVVEEFTSSGQLVWNWNAWQQLGASSSIDAYALSYNGIPAVDAFHCNSVDYTPGLHRVIVSTRHASAVWEINRDVAPNAPDAVVWKLGGNGSVPNGARHLTPQGDPETGFSMEHDARVQTINANDEPTRISMYDNHSALPNPPNGSRGVVYDIGGAGAAQFERQFPVAPSGSNAAATGSFRIYDNGADNLVGWGWKGGSGFTEFDQNGNAMLTQTFPKGDINYRVVKVPTQALDLNLMRKTAGLPRPAYRQVDWSRIPTGALTSGPALSTWSTSRSDIFGRGGDGQLWHATWNGSTWSSWEPLGGSIAAGTRPAAVAWAPGRIDVFVKGLDSQLWQNAWTGSGWSGWIPLGGALDGSPAVTSRGVNFLDVVVTSTDHAAYHAWWDGVRWNAWEPLGGYAIGGPTVASWDPGRVDVFVRGGDSQLWQLTYQNGWRPWASQLGNLSTDPGAASLQSGELDVVAGGDGGVPERLQYSGTWQLWQPLGETTHSSPAITRIDASTETVCITGDDGGVRCGPITNETSPSSSVRAPAPASRADVGKL